MIGLVGASWIGCYRERGSVLGGEVGFQGALRPLPFQWLLMESQNPGFVVKGVSQGDPLSPFLCTLMVDVLTHLISSNGEWAN